jgi:monovalent cation:proton antiporter-2 (CPA2) family protein
MAADGFLIAAATYLGAAVVSVPVAERLGLGSVLGYLVAGVVVGPSVLGLVSGGPDVRHVAEFGVVMMLFLIGLELQPAKLWQMRAAVFGLGAAQLGLTAALVAVAALLMGAAPPVAIAAGLVLAMSSTAIVLQALTEKGLMRSSAGEASFAILLFQDLAVVPVLAVLPLLAGTSAPADGHGGGLDALPNWAAALVVVAAVAGIVLAGRLVMRPLFLFLAKTRMREIFTATALLMVAGTAVLMQTVGLSPALGAFLAGVVLADSEFRHEIESDIEPFKGLLLGLFFISVGAGLPLDLVARAPLVLAGLVAGTVALKAAVVYAVVRAAKLTRPDALIAGIALSQIGEFAFVLIGFAAQTGLFRPEPAALMTAAVALTMLTTPLLFMLVARFGPDGDDAGGPERQADAIAERNRVIIAGFGRVGQVVARLLVARGIRVTVLEHDPEQLEALRRFGFKVYFGDARRHDLLASAGAGEARLLVVATDDRDGTEEIVAMAKRNFPHLKLVARAFDRPHAYDLERAGADLVIRETFAAAVDMGAGALRLLGVPAFEAERTGRIFRRHDQESFEALRALRDADIGSYGLAFRERREMLKSVLARDFQTVHAVDDLGWDAEPASEAAPRPEQETPASPPPA